MFRHRGAIIRELFTTKEYKANIYIYICRIFCLNALAAISIDLHLFIPRSESLNFTDFVKPYSCVGLVKSFLSVFTVADGICLLRICVFYVIHAVHILVLNTSINQIIPRLAVVCTPLFWITPWWWHPSAETCRSFILTSESTLLNA
jgi:hypothetical protein